MKSDPQMLRRENLLILGLTFLGAIVRFWSTGRLGLSHFDEGIYAFAGLWSLGDPGAFSLVVPYAPPGFPILIGISYLIFGVRDVASIAVSQIAGSLTIPVVGWLGRR